jgi:hypothetical protein
MKNTEAVAVRETQAVSTLPADTISKLVLKGDLSSLNSQEKVQYYISFCGRLGLDPATQPFKILSLSGKEVLYCDRGGTQQLGKLHKISHRIEAREVQAECYVVTATAFNVERQTTSIGAVNIAGLKGDALCNAMMKAETKAKRRATLDLCGLGMLDETEIETIPNARTIEVPQIGLGLNAPAAPQRAASPAPAQRPPTAPKAPPTPTAATPSPAKSVNVKACRARFLAVIAKNRDFAWLLAVNKGWILDTEPLENMTDSYIPTTKDAFEAFTLELDGLMTDFDGKFPADKQAQYDAAYDDVPMDDPPVDVEKLKLATDDSWRAFVVPFGKNAGKTLGSLPKNTCFGFYANFKVELEYKGRARKPEAIEKDKTFREALDQAGQFYEFTKPEGEVTP